MGGGGRGMEEWTLPQLGFYTVVALHVAHFGHWLRLAAPALHARTLEWYLTTLVDGKVGGKYVSWFHGVGVLGAMLVLQYSEGLTALHYLALSFVCHTLWDCGKVHGTDPMFLLWLNLHHLGCCVAFAFQAAETPGRAWRNTCFHAWMWGIHSFGMVHDVFLPLVGIRLKGDSKQMRALQHVYSVCFMYSFYLYVHGEGQPGLG
jgi:hypothetical protein